MYNLTVFISHSWSYPGHYEKLAEWIFESPWQVDGTPIEFSDLSVPKDDPIHFAENDRQLRDAIFARIAQTHVVVIPTGMWATHSKWINKEIEGAGQYQRPILAVNPWGQERKSANVIEAASKTVGWTKEGVINGVWSLGPYGRN